MSARMDLSTRSEPMLEFARLLERSQLFEQRLLFLYENCGPARANARSEAAARAAERAIEHGHAGRAMFETGMPNAACVLLRAQYEAVLHGAWALHAATEDQVARMSRPPGADGEPAAGSQPDALAMLKALKTRAASQPQLMHVVALLEEIRAQHGRAMNSFVQGGIHPLQRTGPDFPLRLADGLVRVSNGLTHFAFRQLARLGGPPSVAAQIDQAWQDFEDCCPLAPP
jgi:plasmid stabilization system protein ParE